MAGTVKKLEFAEGTDVGAPTDLSLATSTTVISAFANDAAYVTSEGAAIEGSVYLNSTTNKFRMYVGGAWRNAVPESDSSDATKVFLVDVSGNTTGVSSTIKFVATANRVYTFPNGTGNDDVVLRTLVQVLTNKELTAALLDQPVIKSNAGTATIQANTPGDDVTLFSNADDITIGQSSSDVIIPGNLTVQGTTTSINSANLAVTDQNITVNNGGNDVSAEGAGLTVDRTGTDGSLVYQDSLASKWKAGALGSEIQLANVSSAQAFTNKDYDGGTASNTSRMTLPKNTKTNLDALTRKEATIVYSTDLQKAYVDNGSTLVAIGSGTGSGEINYATNSDAETDATNTAVYKDAAGAAPVDGTGGSPTITLTRSTSSPLRGNASFLLTKPASNVQGEGYAWTLNTVDLPDRNKKLKVQFDYDFTDANFAYGDVLVFIYDITNTTVIVPQNNIVDKGSGTHVATWDATSSSSYRMILHHATTSALAYTLKVDNVIVGPGFVAKGAAVSGANSYTLTFGATTTAPTQGSGATKSATWWRVGSKMRLQFEYTQTNAGSAGSGTYLFPLPAGHTIDTSFFQAGSIGGGGASVGSARIRTTGTVYDGNVQVYNSTNLSISTPDSASVANNIGSGNAPLSTAIQYYSFEAEVPIAEWANSGTVNLLVEDNLRQWATFTPVFTGSSSGTLGLTAGSSARFRRVGDELEVVFQGRFSSLGSGNLLMTLPNSYTVDANSPELSIGSSAALGAGGAFINSGNTYSVQVGVNNSTTVSFLSNYNIADSAGSRLRQILANDPTVNTDYLSFKFRVPVTQFANSQNGLVGFAGATSTVMGLTKLAGDYVYVNTGNGYGSTATRRRRFSGTATTVGTAITYAQTSTNASTFTITQKGIYAITYGDSGSSQWGAAIARNTNGTTNPGILTAFTQRLAKHTIQAGFEHVMNWTGVLEVGDVIDATADTAANGTDDQVFFWIVQVAKL